MLSNIHIKRILEAESHFNFVVPTWARAYVALASIAGYDMFTKDDIKMAGFVLRTWKPNLITPNKTSQEVINEFQLKRILEASLPFNFEVPRRVKAYVHVASGAFMDEVYTKEDVKLVAFLLK